MKMINTDFCLVAHINWITEHITSLWHLFGFMTRDKMHWILLVDFCFSEMQMQLCVEDFIKGIFSILLPRYSLFYALVWTKLLFTQLYLCTISIVHQLYKLQFGLDTRNALVIIKLFRLFSSIVELTSNLEQCSYKVKGPLYSKFGIKFERKKIVSYSSKSDLFDMS